MTFPAANNFYLNDLLRWGFNDSTYDLAPVADNAYGIGTQALRAKANGFLPANHLFSTTTSTGIPTSGGTSALTLLGTAGGGSKTPATGFLNAVGRGFIIKASGTIGANATPNLTIQLKLGSTVILDTTVLALSAITGTAAWTYEGIVKCSVAGATGTLVGQSRFEYGTTVTGTTVVWLAPAASTATPVDLTPSLAIDLLATCSASHASNIVLCNFATAFMLPGNA